MFAWQARITAYHLFVGWQTSVDFPKLRGNATYCHVHFRSHRVSFKEKEHRENASAIRYA